MSDTDRTRLLAQFERKPSGATSVPDAVDSDSYEAFKPVDKRQLRLLIRPASDAWEWVTYGYLLRIVADGAAGTRVILVFTFMAVTITGRNLHAIADAIANERCDFIQEFDAKRWQAPTDPKAPFIQSIEFLVDKPPMKAAEEVREREAA